MNMSANIDGDEPRRSNRLRKREPEFAGLEGPERTPTKPDPRPSKEGRDLNHNSEVKEEAQPAEYIVLSRHKKSYKNGENVLKHNFTISHTSSSEMFENENQSKENICTQKYVTPNTMLGSQRQRIQPPSGSSLVYKIILGLVFVILGIFLLGSKVSEKETINDLKSSFPQQSDRLWGFVSHGMNDAEPFVLLLVHDGEAELANCLAGRIAAKVGRGRTSRTVNPIILNGRDDHSNLLLTLRSQMEKHHALVLQNVEYLNGNVADKLHFILDTFEPWVPGGVYVLTLHVPSINGSKDTFSNIRTFLRKKWSGLLKDDDLDPLIARICNFDYVIMKDVNPCR